MNKNGDKKEKANGDKNEVFNPNFVSPLNTLEN